MEQPPISAAVSSILYEASHLRRNIARRDVFNGHGIALKRMSFALATKWLVHADPRKGKRVMRPDHYFAIMSIMRYGSLLLAMLCAGKLAAFAATHM